jgi:hypothetical protein
MAPIEELDDSTKGLEVWHGAGFGCVDVRSLLQTLRVHIYTLVLTRLLVDYEYNIYYLNYCPGANVHLVPAINSFLPYIWATSSFIHECFFLQAQTALLPNDGTLPTASIFTESFEEIFLPNDASLPNSGHKSVPFLYHFLVYHKGCVHVDLMIGSKTLLMTFFVIEGKGAYSLLLGRDWIHANCCIPSTMHQQLVQWVDDDIEVVQADDSVSVANVEPAFWEYQGIDCFLGKDWGEGLVEPVSSDQQPIQAVGSYSNI